MDGTAVPSPKQVFDDELAAARNVAAQVALTRSAKDDPAPGKALEPFRKQAEEEFTRIAGAAAAAHPDFGSLTRELWVTVGRLLGNAERLDQFPFNPSPVTKKLHERSDAGETEYVADIRIRTREVAIPAEMGALKAQIDAVTNVINAVFAERLRAKPLLWTTPSWEDEVHARQGDYLAQVAGVAHVGLSTGEVSRTAFAKADLDRIKALFKLQEGGRIKNRYNTVLFGWCALATLVSMALYWATHEHWLDATVGGRVGTILYNLRNFWVLAAGTSIGTWLSFSLRRQDIAFEDLAALEPDRLDPWARVAFMIGLAGLVGLLLFTGAIVAGVGSADGGAGMRGNGPIALLVGLLAGVAERALGNAVGRRGEEFAAAVGGTSPPKPAAGGAG